jgi:hypothetical protein
VVAALTPDWPVDSLLWHRLSRSFICWSGSDLVDFATATSARNEPMNRKGLTREVLHGNGHRPHGQESGGLPT